MDEEITWSRVVMNRDIKRLAQEIVQKAERLSVLEISGERWRVEGPGTKYTRLNYPEFDICENKLEEQFDLVIAEMVFEHLKYPYRAGMNCYEMTAAGGHFLMSAPFMFPIHHHPIDCSRWSREGMKYFLHECGFPLEKIYTNSWGNRECFGAICKAKDYIVLYAGQSLVNEEDCPISVWGLAQK